MVTAIVRNLSVSDNDIFALFCGHMLFYILQKNALIMDVILKRFLSASVSRNINYVSLTNELNFHMFQMLVALSGTRAYIDQYNEYCGPITFYLVYKKQI